MTNSIYAGLITVGLLGAAADVRAQTLTAPAIIGSSAQNTALLEVANPTSIAISITSVAVYDISGAPIALAQVTACPAGTLPPFKICIWKGAVLPAAYSTQINVGGSVRAALSLFNGGTLLAKADLR